MKYILWTIFFLIFTILYYGCRTIHVKKPEYITRCNYAIKNRYIDSGIKDSMALIYGDAIVLGYMNKDTMYGCGGIININRKNEVLWTVGDKYYLKVPAEKIVLYFNTLCVGPYYYTDTIDVKSQEKIELDVVLYEFVERKPIPANMILMEEKK